MPTYEYKCDSCGHMEVAQRKIDDRDAPCICTSCGGLCKRGIFSPLKQQLYGSQTGYTRYERIKYRL